MPSLHFNKYHAHDCKKCNHLGSMPFDDGASLFDFYACKTSYGVEIIARDGVDGEYSSCDVESLERSKIRGANEPLMIALSLYRGAVL